MMLHKRNVRDEYFQWLCDQVGVEGAEGSYYLFLKTLHKKIFTWFVPNDDNRAVEGKSLRDKFHVESGTPFSFDSNKFADGEGDTECTMLELILALAVRCYTTLEDTPDNVPVGEWFWKLLNNVGLANCTDDSFAIDWDDYITDGVLDKIINRTYHRSGKGGLFPIKYTKKDQRKVELWYQMSEYLVENYYTK